jgi:hypothetical protein
MALQAYCHLEQKTGGGGANRGNWNKARSSGKNWSPTFLWYDTHHIENDASNNSSIVTCVLVVAGTCLLSRCLAKMGDIHRRRAGWSHKPTFMFFQNRECRIKNFRLAYAYTIIERPLPSNGNNVPLLPAMASPLSFGCYLVFPPFVEM